MLRVVQIQLVLSLVMGLMVGSTSKPAHAESDPRLSREELRQVLTGYLENVRLLRESGSEVEDPHEVREKVARLLKSYRLDSKRALQPIHQGPYPGFVLSQMLEDLYAGLYEDAYQSEHQRVVESMDPEVIFDAFMEMIASGNVDPALPADIQDAASKIGVCLAKKALKGKRSSCVLDKSERLDEPGALAQLWAKVDCSLGSLTMNSCKARKIIFNAAKPQLMAAIRDPKLNLQAVLEQAFRERFPKAFRHEFLREINQKFAAFPELITAKFNTEPGEFWGEGAPLFESDGKNANEMSLSTAAQGLRADSLASATLAVSEDSAHREMASALLYAAANRLLVVMGGQRFRWDDHAKRFVQAPDQGFDSNAPKSAPRFETEAFGGWGLEFQDLKNHDVGLVFTPWDWTSYQPEHESKPSAFRIFPSVFHLDSNGVPGLLASEPPVERLSDLADLVRGVVEFLRVTRSDGPLGKYFGSVEEMGSLMDAHHPLIFPKDGRDLAFGILGGVLKNIVTPVLGHLEEVPYGTRLVFHEEVQLGGRKPNPAPVTSVAKLLIAASDLLDVLKGDPDLPPDAEGLEDQLVEAGQGGAFALGANGQGPDGGFYEVMGQPITEGRTLESQLAGMRALVRIRHSVGIPALLTLLEPSWKFLDRYWSGDELVRLSEDGPMTDRLPPSLAYEILNLWQECQGSIRVTLRNSVPWDLWEVRMERLRQRVSERLESTQLPIEKIEVFG